VRTLRVRLAIVSLAFCLGAPMLLHAAQVRGADEVFPVVHSESIAVRILDGSDGHPIAHAHVSLLAGYNRRDLHLAMWHDDVSTDDHGIARLSDAMANLPFLQISVARRHTCEAHSGSATVSVDLIRRDGLCMPNRCGLATVQDVPGVFTVFVKNKKVAPTPASPSPQRTTAIAAGKK
jgi:hypothetical protein